MTIPFEGARAARFETNGDDADYECLSALDGVDSLVFCQDISVAGGPGGPADSPLGSMAHPFGSDLALVDNIGPCRAPLLPGPDNDGPEDSAEHSAHATDPCDDDSDDSTPSETGPPAEDSAPPEDSGAPLDPPEDGGCGCATGATHTWLLLALPALLLGRRGAARARRRGP